jgi:uncharacterized protein YjiS (DUF1127 family)
MTELLLRPGEVLRVENPGGVLLLRVSTPAGAEPQWEVRFDAPRASWWNRWLLAWREEREARSLAQLDERLLNDIGLGPCAGNPLAVRIHAHRQHELRRLQMSRLGLI